LKKKRSIFLLLLHQGTFQGFFFSKLFENEEKPPIQNIQNGVEPAIPRGKLRNISLNVVSLNLIFKSLKNLKQLKMNWKCPKLFHNLFRFLMA